MIEFGTDYYRKKGHTYCCEDCDYRWLVEAEIGDEKEISLDYEDSFNTSSSLVCPMCGSSYVSEM
ncbi:MAG: hypothetical protein QME81_18115 [bacterium]|nr:hypothetical protein [bacterium]